MSDYYDELVRLSLSFAELKQQFPLLAAGVEAVAAENDKDIDPDALFEESDEEEFNKMQAFLAAKTETERHDIYGGLTDRQGEQGLELDHSGEGQDEAVEDYNVRYWFSDLTECDYGGPYFVDKK